ncbi:hypothetical protein L228DRAFT_246786 [Xylona heveae TC161]|uniref:Uncharacterized protein n=1 Tax=Xylona heveae (strain CBS 132557 / TC161) TaxID=1328760 RepID=A0A165GR26_XYLHT|nr:hypothetical protein L228DRAFT_246786 [Xylona heveae TC161]KZF22488.1 hypothetical protein L228DRAFT_246786 [Xylona heveae TC161]
MLISAGVLHLFRLAWSPSGRLVFVLVSFTATLPRRATPSENLPSTHLGQGSTIRVGSESRLT